MKEEDGTNPTPTNQPVRTTVDGRLELRGLQLSRSRYRLLNLRECEAPRQSNGESSESPE